MKNIYVTQPDFPNYDNYINKIKELWDTKHITNSGKFNKLFINKLEEFLNIKNITLVNNGTTALIIAIKALNLSGEIITTPYTFIATSNSIIWNNITPIFCDVDAIGNIDADNIEQYITNKTTAILAVHLYGNPANVKKLNNIAIKYNLKIVYDAAHAFNVDYENKSILSYGDISILSFHATKGFNTIEGGAIISKDVNIKHKIDKLINFGFDNELLVTEFGLNGKLNEFQSIFGMLLLDDVENNIQKRKKLTNYYRKLLKNIKGITYLNDINNVKHNYSYFPIFIDNNYKLTRDELYYKLKNHNIHSRRYFYPLITDLKIYKETFNVTNKMFPNAYKLSNSVICLPIYTSLTYNDIKKIVSYIV